MVPKADSGAFLLLFLLVLTVTEPLRPGARRGGRGAWGRGGRPAGGGAAARGPGGPGRSRASLPGGPRRGRAQSEASGGSPRPRPGQRRG